MSRRNLCTHNVSAVRKDGIFSACPGQSKHQNVILLVGRKGYEDRHAIPHAIALQIEAHQASDLLRAWNLPTDVLDILQQSLRSFGQAWHVAQLRHVSFDELLSAAGIQICAMECLAEVNGTLFQLSRCKTSCAFACRSFVVRVQRAAEVDCRTEDVVPRHKPKEPVALYLRFYASGHHSHPQRWLHARRVASSSVAHFLCVLRHVGHAGAELEEKSEGHSKVPGVELRHELVPRRNDVLGHASVVADGGAFRIALQVVCGSRKLLRLCRAKLCPQLCALASFGHVRLPLHCDLVVDVRRDVDVQLFCVMMQHADPLGVDVRIVVTAFFHDDGIRPRSGQLMPSPCQIRAPCHRRRRLLD